MSVLSKLTFQIAAQGSAQVKKELAEVDKRAAEAGRSIKSAFSEKVALGFAGAVTAAMVKLGMEFDSFLARYDEIGKLATRTGLDPKAIDQFRILEKLTGQAEGNLARAFNFFQRQIGEGKVNAFEEMLGLDSVGTVEERFRNLLNELSRIDAGDPNKNVLVNKLFGEDSGREMLKMLNAGELGLQEMLATTGELANANEDVVRRVEQFNDSVTMLGENFHNLLEENVFDQMVESATVLVKLMERISQISESISLGPSPTGFQQGVGNLGIFNVLTTQVQANKANKQLREAIASGDSEAIQRLAKKAKSEMEQNIAASTAYGFGDKAKASWEDSLKFVDMLIGDRIAKRLDDAANLLSEPDLYAGEASRGKPKDPFVAFQEEMDRQKAADNAYWNTLNTQARPMGPMDAVTGLFESELEKLRKDLTESLESVAMLPEAEVWSNVLSDLRDGNNILMSIDGSLQVIKQKNPLSVEVVK